MKLNQAPFGRTDRPISELGLSTSNFSRYASREESLAVLDAFHEAGGNFVQTSGICPGVNLGDGFLGMPEELLGRWLELRRVARESIVIATRIALTRPVIGGLDTYTELIRRCAEDSIRRIGCGHLDLLVVEWTDAIAPVAETLAACAAVIASGAVRHIVPANFPLSHLRQEFAAARETARCIAGLQIDYSLALRMALEGGAAAICAERSLGLITRAPLAGGHLAGRPLGPGLGGLRHRGAGDRHAAIAADGLWPALSSLAAGHRCTPAQVALAWVLAHPQITSVLVSVSTAGQLQELFAATRLALGREDLARLGTPPSRRSSGDLAPRC